MSARRRPAGKHRRPGKHRRASTSPSPTVLLGTAVVATAAAALLTGPSSQALGDVKRPGSTGTTALGLGLARAAAAVPSPTASPTPSATPSTTPKARTKAAARSGRSAGAAKRSTRASRGGERGDLLEAPLAPQWVKPVERYTLTAHFGEGGGLWSHGHTGQDFAAPTGTPVKAAGAGVVVSTERAGAYGNRIVLHHSDGTETWYCHLSAFQVEPGDAVEAGQVIGRVGSTGNTTGPHLHFEVRPGGGDAIDPMPWLRAHGVRV
ncbi:murein DD-endopeptidase MepM/ murein hydrolase activator NlpD [Motilibacter peucedani]|uniref:Murein DD-endopeptidase MepM/ murein hydrolase activator NlpD n=1 Tax=Motilibacter peucedani TaxID=598650 RepID=A0A420XLD8_9ACTN|nr:M23 family metallopeptidase [Motilibacter peucedani]RKS69346.1 murein DD-endopeptidase MepM/ murein hydrolase activator NlpD [Motilibacter peucedani]